MCTGIVHIYTCCNPRCGGIVYKIKNAAPGYTCPQARLNRQRGVCRTGIAWSSYNHVADENCQYCELYCLTTEISDFTAETCEEGTPWPEDAEDEEVHHEESFAAVVADVDEVDVEDGGAPIRSDDEDEDEDEDEQEGGVRIR
ncbi:hypothetical protein GGR50DRAFT_622107 [Xylaria sp. CBS 124048]|nr:hypothetical protein GGR50DRAFT_622107 [Xylaria sp. CBS 124048]